MQLIPSICFQLPTPCCTLNDRAAEIPIKNLRAPQQSRIEFYELVEECTDVTIRLYAPQCYWPHDTRHLCLWFPAMLWITTTASKQYKKFSWILVSISHQCQTQIPYKTTRISCIRLYRIPAMSPYKARTVKHLHRPRFFAVDA